MNGLSVAYQTWRGCQC